MDGKLLYADRAILHSDINSCYASIEIMYDPSLRGKPVAVVGDVEQRHGIVLAKSQEAKKFSVSTGEAIWQAQQKCRNLICVPAHYDRYMEISEKAHKLYYDYTDQVEAFGLDECWLDITGSMKLFGSARTIATKISQRFNDEFGLTVSIGASWNKIYAKLGSDYRKPDAITVFNRQNYKAKIWPLPASDLLYVGRATTKKLANYGIRTIGQLAEIDPEFLQRLLGKWGYYLHDFATGKDRSPVASQGYTSPIKSIGHSITTHRDIMSFDEAWQVLISLAEDITEKLRKHGFRCKTVSISIRDNELIWFERQAKLDSPVCTSYDIAKAGMQLLTHHYDFRKPLRSLGLRACDLTDINTAIQLSFLDNAARRARWENIEGTVDKIRGRFGKTAIARAALIGANIIHEYDPLTHDVHPMSYTI
jgi:DNA polymerase-4